MREASTWLLAQGWALLGPVVLIVMLVVSVGMWLWARRRHRERSREQREALGAPATKLVGATGGVVTLEGTLQVGGEPCRRVRDGAPVAAESIMASRHRFWGPDREQGVELGSRAEELCIDIGGRKVALVGPLQVVVGSRSWWLARSPRWLPDGLRERLPKEAQGAADLALVKNAVFRSVSDGDRVVVRGSPTKQGEDPLPETMDYRVPAEDSALTGMPETGAIEVVARQARFSVTPLRMLLSLVPWLCGQAAGLVWAKSVVWFGDEDRQCRLECEVGHCAAYLTQLVPPRTACRADAGAVCRGSWACTNEGRCTVVGVECGASSSEDCRRSTLCTTAGLCTLSPGGQCVAGSDDDCRPSVRCAESGLCRARDGKCVLSEARVCRTRPECKERGHCTVTAEHCGVASDADCDGSTLCTEQGRCSATPATLDRPGECVARSREDCAQGKACRERGMCSPSEGRCYAAADEDCAKAEVCSAHEQCRAQDGRCVGEDNPCLRSEECPKSGDCTPVGSVCIIGSDRDCRQSEDCRAFGACSELLGSCQVLTDSDCAGATVCSFHQRCFAGHGACQAQRPE